MRYFAIIKHHFTKNGICDDETKSAYMSKRCAYVLANEWIKKGHKSVYIGVEGVGGARYYHPILDHYNCENDYENGGNYDICSK